MGLLRGWNNPTNYWSGSGGHILVSHPWAIPHGYLMLRKLRPHRWTNVTHEQPTLTYLVDKVVVFQGTNNAMTVTTEVFGQLKHINNWCFTLLVAFYTSIHSDIDATETKTIAETEMGEPLALNIIGRLTFADEKKIIAYSWMIILLSSKTSAFGQMTRLSQVCNRK